MRCLNRYVNPSDFQLFMMIFSSLHIFSFQLPDFLSQVKEALGLPAVAAPVPVTGPSSAPVLPVPSVPPPIVLEDDDETEGVQTLAVPCRAGSSEAFLPMVSTDDSWTTDAEFRFVFSFLFLTLLFGLQRASRRSRLFRCSFSYDRFRILSWISAPFCRSLFYKIRIFCVQDRHVDMSIRPRVLVFNDSLEGVDSFDVLLHTNIGFGFYPGFQHRFVGLYSIRFGYFVFKIDMLTCRSVQETNFSILVFC